MITGVGLNCHNVKITNAATKFPFVSWVRVDDLPPNTWNATNQRSLVAFYQALGWKVVYIVLSSWGVDIAGHARDVAIQCRPDAIEVYNEPEQGEGTFVYPPVAAAQQAADLLRVTQQGLAHLTTRPLVLGPSMAQWDMRTGQIQRAHWDAFFAAGGHNHCDMITCHPYQWFPAENGVPKTPADIATWSADIKTRTKKPVLWTERGFDQSEVEARLGAPWTAAKGAQCYYDWAQAAVAAGDGFCMYDGPYNGSVYVSMLKLDATASDMLLALQALYSPSGDA